METSSSTNPTPTPTRPRHRHSPSSDRLLGIPTPNQSQSPSPTISSPGGGVSDDFTEDDVFWTGHFPPDSNHHHHHTSNGNNHNNLSSSAAAASSTKGLFGRSENYGILAALPEAQTRSVFNHKASASSSPSSSSTTSFRMIPTVPKKPPLSDRQNHYYQSAPVNIPVLSEAMQRSRARQQFDDIDDDIDDGEGEGDGQMLPPHEIVAAKQSPALANSVLEGVGRTLKGRDLRQVRNAVWRRTGFLD
ncbi:hypothetical protein LguiB_031585 [Lonicera macranthoides]